MVHRAPFILPWLYPTLVWRMPSLHKELYLTFDDGPVPGPTAFVLDTLNHFNIKATFFCIGENIAKHPDLFKRILQEGHSVGNHTFNHLNGWRSTTPKYLDNIERANLEILKCHSGYKGNLFRPPYGRITRSQIKTLNNYKIIMWDVLSVDYNRHLHTETCLLNSLKATRNGSIIVFHDSYKAEKNMAYVLPRFIKHFIKQGYVFKTIPE